MKNAKINQVVALWMRWNTKKISGEAFASLIGDILKKEITASLQEQYRCRNTRKVYRSSQIEKAREGEIDPLERLLI